MKLLYLFVIIYYKHSPTMLYIFIMSLNEEIAYLVAVLHNHILPMPSLPPLVLLFLPDLGIIIVRQIGIGSNTTHNMILCERWIRREFNTQKVLKVIKR